jgi:hypothetical protein
MAGLVACPFCRVMYERSEASTCSVCGMKLVPFERLPPSADALAEDVPTFPTLPEDELLPWTFPGRGRGALLALSILGIALFFAPWVVIEIPEDTVRSGFDLARGRAGWLWGGVTGWFILVPLVITRRTIHKLRGARPIAVAFSAMTLGEVVMLLSMPPPVRRVPLEMHFAWGIYASGLASLACTLVAVFLGGSLPPLPPAVREQSSAGETLH